MIQPDRFHAYLLRGELFWELNQLEKAYTDLSKTLDIYPLHIDAIIKRGMTLEKMKSYEKALTDYQRAVMLDPENVRALDLLALMLAASQLTAYETVTQRSWARTACELTNWKSPHQIETYAAAYAEMSDYQSAIKYEEQAINMMSKDNKPVADAQKRLALYRSSKPRRLNTP